MYFKFIYCYVASILHYKTLILLVRVHFEFKSVMVVLVIDLYQLVLSCIHVEEVCTEIVFLDIFGMSYGILVCEI